MCLALIVASVLFEVGGLGVLAWQLGRVQRREFGTPGWWEQVRRWSRALRGSRVVSSSVTLRGGAAAGSGGGAIAQVRRGPGTTVDSRLDALERNQAALDRELDQRFQRQDDRRAQLLERITALEVRLRSEQDAREDERLTALRESMAYQWIGTVLFLIGAILAGLANGVC